MTLVKELRSLADALAGVTLSESRANLLRRAADSLQRYEALAEAAREAERKFMGVLRKVADSDCKCKQSSCLPCLARQALAAGGGE
jgi:hypothetical protein